MVPGLTVGCHRSERTKGVSEAGPRSTTVHQPESRQNVPLVLLQILTNGRPFALQFVPAGLRYCDAQGSHLIDGNSGVSARDARGCVQKESNSGCYDLGKDIEARNPATDQPGEIAPDDVLDVKSATFSYMETCRTVYPSATLLSSRPGRKLSSSIPRFRKSNNVCLMEPTVSHSVPANWPGATMIRSTLCRHLFCHQNDPGFLPRRAGRDKRSLYAGAPSCS